SLKAYYKENQRDQIKLTDLARRVGLNLRDVQECLSYMVEGSWWGSRTTDFFSTDDPHIKPSEAILRYSTFYDVVNQLREWQHYRIQDRARFQEKPSRDLSVREASPSPFDFLGQASKREKPFWFQTLSSDFQ